MCVCVCAEDDIGDGATMEGAIQLFAGQAPGTPASLAHADVLLACILHSSNSAAALSNALAALFGQVDSSPCFTTIST
jgi:hypothetical protein